MGLSLMRRDWLSFPSMEEAEGRQGPSASAQAPVLLAQAKAQGETVNALKDLIFTGHQAGVSGFHWAKRATVLFLSVESNKSQPIWIRYGAQEAEAGDLCELEPALL